MRGGGERVWMRFQDKDFDSSHFMKKRNFNVFENTFLLGVWELDIFCLLASICLQRGTLPR